MALQRVQLEVRRIAGAEARQPVGEPHQVKGKAVTADELLVRGGRGQRRRWTGPQLPATGREAGRGVAPGHPQVGTGPDAVGSSPVAEPVRKTNLSSTTEHHTGVRSSYPLRRYVASTG